MEQLYSPDMSDEVLADAARVERNAFGLLVERYEQPLRRYVTRLGVRNHDDQLDVLQEVFLKAYRNINSFDTKLKFSSWIYRIAHNEAVSWFRKRNARPEGHAVADGEEVIEFLRSGEVSPEEQFDTVVNAEAVNIALRRLDDRYRNALILRYFEHKEYQEISDILRVPVGTVGTLLHRGKQQLAHELNAAAIRM
ncbi:MAG: RNA polymerase sigma factor [Patescibacteria group bacterium]